MRWDDLFRDLEGQYDEVERQELSAEVADRVRRETARVRLADRARLAVGVAMSVGLGPAGVVGGRLVAAGPDWLLLRPEAQPDHLIATQAASWVTGLPGLATEPDSVGVVESRLGLAHALRGIARDRSTVAVVLRDGTVLSGTIDRVGADFLDLAEHPLGEARRAGELHGVRTVAVAALAVVRAR